MALNALLASVASTTTTHPATAPLQLTYGGWGANDWIALAGLLQVLVLVVAALYAGRQVAETRKLRRPYVIAYAKLNSVSRVLIEIVIKNIGQAPAYDTFVTFDPDLRSSVISDGEITWSALVDGVPFLAPHQEMTHLLDSAISLYGAKEAAANGDVAVPTKYQVTIRSHDRPQRAEKKWWMRNRRQFVETCTIDLGVWFGSHYTTELGVHHVAEELQAIHKAVDRWTESLDGIRVYVLDLEKEQEKREALWEERRQSHRELVGRLTPPTSVSGDDQDPAGESPDAQDPAVDLPG